MTATLVTAALLLAVVSVGGTSSRYGTSGPRPPVAPPPTPPPGEVHQLQTYDVFDNQITLSGFSSGGTFAQQLQFAYSSLFSGIAVFSHTYYRCGPPDGRVSSYDSLCTKLFNFTEAQLYNASLVHQDIQDYLRRGLIEDPRNLRNKRLYVYAGLRNVLFSPRQSLSIVPVYQPYIGNLNNIFTRVHDANHVLPTNNRNYGGPCTEPNEESFFIGQCGFSGVEEALNFLLSLSPAPSSSSSTGFGRPRVATFDQREFTRGLSNHHLDSVGYYYVPPRCGGGFGGSGKERCYLHLYFHGCLNGRQFANATHVENTGLIELAERHGIILVFPQALSSLPENEIGCWDTFGIGGPLYATQQGPQVIAVKRMLDRLVGKRGQSFSFGSSSSWPWQFTQGTASTAQSSSSAGGRAAASTVLVGLFVALLLAVGVESHLREAAARGKRAKLR